VVQVAALVPRQQRECLRVIGCLGIGPLHVTPAGEQLFHEIAKLAQEHGRDFLAPLDERDQQALAALLSRLAEGHGLTAGVHPGYSSMAKGKRQVSAS
jgi:hypothetical protein